MDNEPSAYEFLRRLKKAGYVSAANLEGEVMASVSEHVPDEPLAHAMPSHLVDDGGSRFSDDISL